MGHVEPQPAGDVIEPATQPFELPPIHRPWLVFVGIALPFAADAIGWWTAGMAAAGRHEDAWWDAAGDWVYLAVVAAMIAAVGCCLPVFRQIQHASQVVLAVAVCIAYFFALLLVNIEAYFHAGGPFP